jgi:hypothetical protein
MQPIEQRNQQCEPVTCETLNRICAHVRKRAKLVNFKGGSSASDTLVLGAGGAFPSLLQTKNLSIVQRDERVMR